MGAHSTWRARRAAILQEPCRSCISRESAGNCRILVASGNGAWGHFPGAGDFSRRRIATRPVPTTARCDRMWMCACREVGGPLRGPKRQAGRARQARRAGRAGQAGQAGRGQERAATRKTNRPEPQMRFRPLSERSRAAYFTETLIIAVVQQQPVAPPPFSEKSVSSTCST